MLTMSIKGALNLMKECDILKYFLKKEIKKEYYEYLGLDFEKEWKYNLKKIVDTLNSNIKNTYLFYDDKLIFFAVFNEFRSKITGIDTYKVKIFIPLNIEHLKGIWHELRKKLPRGVFEVELSIKQYNEVSTLCSLGWINIGVDIRMNLKKKYFPPYIGKEFIEYKREYKKKLFEIIDEHKGFYLFNSPFYHSKAVTHLLKEWTIFSHENLKSKLFFSRMKNEITGFINLLDVKSFSRRIGKKIGIIDFIMVKSKFRGKNIADALLSFATNEVFQDYDFLELKTFLQNLNAINFYINKKFKITQSSFILQFGNF